MIPNNALKIIVEFVMKPPNLMESIESWTHDLCQSRGTYYANDYKLSNLLGFNDLNQQLDINN